MLEHVIGTAEPENSTPDDINLIGEHNIAGAICNVLPLLENLGIRVLAKITGDAIYKEVCYAHRAKLNVILSYAAFYNPVWEQVYQPAPWEVGVEEARNSPEEEI